MESSQHSKMMRMDIDSLEKHRSNFPKETKEINTIQIIILKKFKLKQLIGGREKTIECYFAPVLILEKTFYGVKPRLKVR